ncbi:hypothetical protein [Streptomyces sp. NPDC087294]|uniref:hypothetical protein n=1 Tax=Streptomyces sp. NPDC087294 TaxID=3365777 RepID=UPI00381D7329
MPVRPSPSSSTARLLLAALAALATLTLTACEDGEGLRDEGPSTASVPQGDVTSPSEQPPRPSR